MTYSNPFFNNTDAQELAVDRVDKTSSTNPELLYDLGGLISKESSIFTLRSSLDKVV